MSLLDVIPTWPLPLSEFKDSKSTNTLINLKGKTGSLVQLLSELVQFIKDHKLSCFPKCGSSWGSTWPKYLEYDFVPFLLSCSH